MIKLYVVRHGRTDWNDRNQLQGRMDIPLNEKGKEEALKLLESFPSDSYDVCFCSPLLRAKETAEILTDGKRKIIYDDLLLERDLGEYEGDFLDKEKIKNMWNPAFDFAKKKIESPEEVLLRAKTFLSKLKSYQDKKILIVSHGAFIKALHYTIIGYDSNTDFSSFHPKNTTVYTYEI